MNKLLIIGGPTATGKTGLGVYLAKQFNGEIVSADSRQVYRGMDIGTGKDLPVSAKRKVKNEKLKLKTKKFQTLKPYRFNDIPVWMLDVVTPDYRFSVADYQALARAVVEDIWKRKKLAILVGGTGLYIKGLIEGIETVGIKPDWELRKKLSNLEIEKLGKKLKKLDPQRLQRMNQSDRQNPRRLIRAIEIALANNKQTKQSTINYQPSTIDNYLIICLRAPNKFLYQRIDKRVEKRVKQGLEAEIKGLVKLGYNWDNSALGSTLGYQEWQPLLENSNHARPSEPGEAREAQKAKLREEIIKKWQFAEHHYARRQLTWFKKMTTVNWFDISSNNWQNDLELRVKTWYDKKND